VSSGLCRTRRTHLLDTERVDRTGDDHSDGQHDLVRRVHGDDRLNFDGGDAVFGVDGFWSAELRRVGL